MVYVAHQCGPPNVYGALGVCYGASECIKVKAITPSKCIIKQMYDTTNDA